MPLSYLPRLLATAFADLAHWLDRRSALRVPLLLFGLLLARGRRTCTSWFRAAGIREDYRNAYTTICAVGRHTRQGAVSVLAAVKPLLDPGRLRLTLDDTPTPRYGPQVEGAGVHHNPTPGPAGEKHVYGHVWVTLTALADHPDWGCIALPLQAQPYIRQADLPKLPPERRRPFRTKLEMAAELLRWAKTWAGHSFEELWAVADGAYAKRPVLKAARAAGITLISRLRKDAALWSMPPLVEPGQRRGRGRPRIYGERRVSLAKRAGHKGGWQTVECVQYGEAVTKTIKTFLATYRPAGGVVRVVIVKEEDDWLPYFSTAPGVSAEEILEAMADRGAHEQMNKDVKEVEGAGQQQVRNLHSNEGCFNMNLWIYSLVEAWAWRRPEGEVCDRGDSPWDSEPRRPSHADKRKALRREVLRGEIEAVLSARPGEEEIRALAERLLEMAV